MPSITFDLETVTPLFLSGADQTIAELRPPAFRGALRYWFRALAGGYYWDQPQKLQELESSIFGNAGSIGSSKVVLRISQMPTIDPYEYSMRQDGIKYLWFSTKAQRREQKTAREAIGIDEPVRFSLKFSIRPIPNRRKEQQRDLVLAANSFWMAVNLGGFGSRERRGAGSLRVIKFTYEGLDDFYIKALPKFSLKFKSEDIPRFFRGEINKIQSYTNHLLKLDPIQLTDTFLPEFEIYRSDIGNDFFNLFFLNKEYNDWENLLDYWGKEYSAYRRNIPASSRYVFGLPLKNIQSRRSSPLRMKVVRSLDKYFGLLSWNYGTFPTEARINSRDKFQVIEQFIKRFPNLIEIF
ncbi:MAG: type III-B CRISPR module RAMP protein Cmr1 [Pseudanabaena sp. Salubria-1]|nr:type III-B CRISPR module RAMP protein Cmr1 [Pseudanabaena sp. Salubria-1]